MLRLKYDKHGHLLISQKVFSDGNKFIKAVINTETIEFQLVDAVTNHVYETGGQNINNIEVLQRAVKRSIQRLLGIKFEKEARNTKPKYNCIVPKAPPKEKAE